MRNLVFLLLVSIISELWTRSVVFQILLVHFSPIYCVK